MYEEQILAQSKYCKENKVPHFAPENGICWYCKINIYSRIDINTASSELITGCPHCHHTYCD